MPIFPSCIPTFSPLLAKYIVKGTEIESHLLCLLICGKGREILSTFSASQIIKGEAKMPLNPGKRETLEVLKVIKIFIMAFFVNFLFFKAKNETSGVSEIFDESRKLEALSPPTFLRPAPPPLLNEDELIWLNPEDFLVDDKKYMYDTNMCETK